MLPADEKLMKLAEACKAKQWIYAEGDRREHENEKRLSELAFAVPRLIDEKERLLKRIKALKTAIKAVLDSPAMMGCGDIDTLCAALDDDEATVEETEK